MQQWLTSKEIRSKLRISSGTLSNWVRRGQIERKFLCKKGYYLYTSDEDVNAVLDNNKLNVIYTRVSNHKQRNDLERQEVLLREYCISNGIKVDKVYSEVASGMNENRKQFNDLIKDVVAGKIDKVYISYKDRLTRFGFNYFDMMFKLFDTEIVIVNLTKEEDYQNELTNDLVSIIHRFSMKLYSNRRMELKEFKKKLLSKNDNP